MWFDFLFWKFFVFSLVFFFFWLKTKGKKEPTIIISNFNFSNHSPPCQPSHFFLRIIRMQILEIYPSRRSKQSLISSSSSSSSIISFDLSFHIPRCCAWFTGPAIPGVPSLLFHQFQGSSIDWRSYWFMWWLGIILL